MFFKLFIQILHHTLHSDVCPTQGTIKYFQNTFPIPGSVTDQKKRLLCKLHMAISRNILIIESDWLQLQGEVSIGLILYWIEALSLRVWCNQHKNKHSDYLYWYHLQIKSWYLFLVLNYFGGNTRSVGYSRHRFLQNVMFSYLFFLITI